MIMATAARTGPGRGRSGGERAVVTSAAPPHAAPVAKPRRSRGRRALRRLGRALAAVVLTFAVLLGIGWVLTPSVDDAQQLVSERLATNGATALQGDVPTNLAEALIATEDSRFEHHLGVDPIGAARAGWGALTGTDQGGSTLDQQLAKNLYAGGEQSFGDRIQSVVLALKLDAGWSKDALLRMYLDDGYYGHGFYGLNAATEGYFGIEPTDLSWAQATLLAGLFQAPTAYDPFTHPELAKERQAHVLDRLVAVGTLTRAAADEIAAEPWSLVTVG
jgi:membrane peptidoglycan carboxypeptidase